MPSFLIDQCFLRILQGSRAESDEELTTEASLLAWSRGYLTTTSRATGGVHLATLRHFDHLVQYMVKNDPLIPCERRLPGMEIWENQELTFQARFGNRDYDRPFRQNSMTLGRFD